MSTRLALLLWFSIFTAWPLLCVAQLWQNTGELVGAGQIFDLIETSDGSLYAATCTPYGCATVFRTRDGGTKWERMADVIGHLPYSYVTCLLEAADGAIYAGTVFYPHHDCYAEILKTIDGGKSWTVTGDIGKVYAVNCLTQARDGSIYAGTSSGLFRTTDAGSTWSKLEDWRFDWFSVNSVLQVFDGSIWVGFSGGIIYKISEWGSPVSDVGSEPPYWPGHVNSLIQSSDGAVFATSGGTIFKTLDGGHSWQNLVNLHWGWLKNSEEGISLVQTKDGSIYAAASLSGVILNTPDGGAHWVNAGDINDTRGIYCLLQSTDGTIYAGSGNGNIFRLARSLNLAVNRSQIQSGESLKISVTIEPLSATFDAWGIILGEGRVYSFNPLDSSTLQRGSQPLAIGVPGLSRRYSTTLLSLSAIPLDFTGSYRVIVGLVPHGESPAGVEYAIPGYVDEKNVIIAY